MNATATKDTTAGAYPDTTAATSDGARPRILILTSSTGGGHDSRAYSLKTWIEETKNANVRVEHLLENSSWLPRFGVWVYNTIQRRAPGLHNIYWFIAEGFARMQGHKLSFGKKYYHDILEGYRPNLVLSMHDCLNRGYFQEAKAVLGQSVRTCTYCGEWSGGFGYSLNWLEESADLFISRTTDARAFAIENGMDAARCEVFCNVLPPRAFAPPMSKVRRVEFLKELGLSSERFTVLMAAGAVGANNHIRLLNVLVKTPGTQAIAFCGKSQHARARILKWKAKHPDFPLFVEGYSQRVHELLQASDCVISRGGANTTAEALYHECPILFNRLGGVMPQERLTLNYFLNHGAARQFSTVSEFAQTVREMMTQPSISTCIRANLHALRRDDHPRELAAHLIALAAEAANAQNITRA